MNEPTNPKVAILNAAFELSAGQRATYLDQALARLREEHVAAGQLERGPATTAFPALQSPSVVE